MLSALAAEKDFRPLSAIATSTKSPPSRLASLDIYRGFVMFLMASDSFGIPTVGAEFQGESGLAIPCP